MAFWLISKSMVVVVCDQGTECMEGVAAKRNPLLVSSGHTIQGRLILNSPAKIR